MVDTSASPVLDSMVLQLAKNSLPWINKNLAIILSLEFIRTIKACFPFTCICLFVQVSSLVQFFSQLPLILFANFVFVPFAQETKKIQSSGFFLFSSMNLTGFINSFSLKEEYFYFICSRLKHKLRICSLL